MMVEAPPRLSTTHGWPVRSAIFSAYARPSMSLPPPGGNGMTNRTGRTGYFSAACADSAGAAVARTAARITDVDGQPDFNAPSSAQILPREKPPGKKIGELPRL